MAADVDEAPDTEGPDIDGPALHGATMTGSGDQTVLHPDVDSYHSVVAALRGDGYTMCIDVTVVDYLRFTSRDLPAAVSAERYEVVAQFLDMAERRRIRVRVQVRAEDAEVASLTDLYPGAEAMEREAWDMFGVEFTGHRDLTRILMPEEWEGFPLRKDYDVGRIPVQFKAPISGNRS